MGGNVFEHLLCDCSMLLCHPCSVTDHHAIAAQLCLGRSRMSGRRMSGSSRPSLGVQVSCRLFLHFLGKIAVRKMSGRTPGSPRHPSSRHLRPSDCSSLDKIRGGRILWQYGVCLPRSEGPSIPFTPFSCCPPLRRVSLLSRPAASRGACRTTPVALSKS